MAISLLISQQILGYILIALGIIVAITGFISYKKGGKLKVITYIVFVVASIAIGSKFAFGQEKTPVEVKKVEFPKNPHLQ